MTNPAVILNPQRQKFLDEYLKTRKGAHSARHAGYAKASAGNYATKLLREPIIKKEIERREAEAIAKEQFFEAEANVTKEWIILEQTRTYKRAIAGGQVNAANKSLENLFKFCGFDEGEKSTVDAIRELLESVDGSTRGLPKDILGERVPEVWSSGDVTDGIN